MDTMKFKLKNTRISRMLLDMITHSYKLIKIYELKRYNARIMLMNNT